MRKLNVTEFVSVDGVMEAPHEWSGHISAKVGGFKNGRALCQRRARCWEG